MTQSSLVDKAINTIRFLAADAIQKANSGHPGLPMGAAALTYALWADHLKFDPQSPAWSDRDRFVISAGHGSMLLYALLHLTGYDLPMEELKRFRQLESKTPGHPEYGHTFGVETTTGPLGQGFGNGVGMAIAAERMAAMYNRDGFPIVDHTIYAIVSDGDLMEGLSHEAASLAGHLRLGRLVYLYDDNRITIDGSTDLTYTEDRAARFRAYDWHVLTIEDANDVSAVSEAIATAKVDPRPSLIICRTHIGFGLPTKVDTAAAHGEPPGEEELAGAKQNLGWPLEPSFLVPEEVAEHFRSMGNRGAERHREWEALFKQYAQRFPDLAAQFRRTHEGSLPQGLRQVLPTFKPNAKGMATRASSGKTINALAPELPELIGGSADLTGSNKTHIENELPFSSENRNARYIHFGIREHAMAAILNGIALHGGLIPFGGTFLVFSDYMRPSMRLCAMMGLPVIYVLTHDSVGIGEDGPTHQPIEHLASLRVIPNMTVIRPADGNETAMAWMTALERRTGPTVLALTRQRVRELDRNRFASAEGLQRGAYVLADLGSGEPEILLMASGSEVALIIEAGERLASDGRSVRLVSFPSWSLFAEQDSTYQDQVLPPALHARVAIEAGSPQGWERWVGEAGAVIGLQRYGVSAPYEEAYEHLGLTAEKITSTAQQVLARVKEEQG
ncbi:MAG TPA: transketolase [Anaerolineae bacterium]|nr:transketolase [Anaerolineae bacterium]